MKQLLMVDDDPLLTKAYRERLSAHGFKVNTVGSGSAALTILQVTRPDLVVLDLMLPDLSGVEVLKFIRAEPTLKGVPVLLLTNGYMNELGRQAKGLGIERVLLKSQCTPSLLIQVAEDVLGNSATPAAAPQGPKPAPPLPPAAPPPVTPHAWAALSLIPTITQSAADESIRAKAQEHLSENAAKISADLRKLFEALAAEPERGPAQQVRLRDLYRRVHFLVATAGIAGASQLAQAVSVLEALLYVLMDNPARVNPSVLLTVSNLVAFVGSLLQQPAGSNPGSPATPRVLVVDDDPVTNRLVVAALSQVQLEAYSTEDPLVAWQWCNRDRFDLVLLDIEMPGLNGLDLCQRLRSLPDYEKTPVIFVTSHSEFEARAKGSIIGANDLIGKPILPMELAAKVVMHLMRNQPQA